VGCVYFASSQINVKTTAAPASAADHRLRTCKIKHLFQFYCLNFSKTCAIQKVSGRPLPAQKAAQSSA
jgi:hypothetical protein